jgi:predicted small secreted protein
MTKSFIAIIIVLAVSVSLIGCNTLRGAGKDVENAGEGIQKTVNHND